MYIWIYFFILKIGVKYVGLHDNNHINDQIHLKYCKEKHNDASIMTLNTWKSIGYQIIDV